MIPVIGGALGAAAGGSAWSHLGSGAASLAGGLYSNYASARQASINREFQAYMSGTSYQRAVKDLRKAGLNPILAVPGGASTPGGSFAPMGDPGTPAVNSALQARINKAQTYQAREATRLIRNQNTTEETKQSLNRAYKRLANENTRQATALAQKTGHESDIRSIEKSIRSMDLQIALKRFGGDFDAAQLWSSDAYSVKRRSDALAETISKYNPLRGLLNFGGSKPGLRRPSR